VKDNPNSRPCPADTFIVPNKCRLKAIELLRDRCVTKQPLLCNTHRYSIVGYNIVEAPKRLVQVEKQCIQDGLKNLWENEL